MSDRCRGPGGPGSDPRQSSRVHERHREQGNMSTSAIGFAHETGKTVYTVPEAFQETLTLRPDQVALRTVGGTTEITWREYGERVRELAAGLANLGLKHGDTPGIMLTNRPASNLRATPPLHAGAPPSSRLHSTS